MTTETAYKGDTDFRPTDTINLQAKVAKNAELTQEIADDGTKCTHITFTQLPQTNAAKYLDILLASYLGDISS